MSIPVQSENSQQDRPLFMKTWQLEPLATTGAQYTRSGKLYFKYLHTFSFYFILTGTTSFTFLNQFRGNVEAEMSFMKLQRSKKRSDRKQMKKHRRANFPILHNPVVFNAHNVAFWQEHYPLQLLFLRRPSAEPEEDLYLQCDLPEDDAIYSNDPVCDLSILPGSQEEDVYIVPDSWEDTPPFMPAYFSPFTVLLIL